MKRLFKGGTVVSGEGLKKIDLLVKGEKILAAGKNLEFQDAETIDVRGKLLFPGFIDAHTHMAAKFNDITAADKFETGTKAALAGGTTCIIDFAEQNFQIGNSLLCGGKACPLFPDLCGLLAGLRFLHHTDKLGSVMLGIFGNGFEHFRDKG